MRIWNMPADAALLDRLEAHSKRLPATDIANALMGEPDEVDAFFVLEVRAAGVLVMMVTGTPETGQAWVH